MHFIFQKLVVSGNNIITSKYFQKDHDIYRLCVGHGKKIQIQGYERPSVSNDKHILCVTIDTTWVFYCSVDIIVSCLMRQIV